MKTFLAALLTLVSAPCMADVRDVQRAANEYYEQNARAILAEFGALLSLPNHADDRVSDAAMMLKIVPTIPEEKYGDVCIG